MENAKQWIMRNKEQLILAGVVGMLLSPFLWPFFLAILVQTIGFVIPVLIVRAIIQKARKEKQKEKKRVYEELCKEKSAESCAAMMWYHLEGRERILRLMKKLEKEDRWSFSISQEGICSVCEEKRYRRIGVLPSFPGREMKVLERELRKERIHAVRRGKFLWLSWGKEYRQ